MYPNLKALAELRRLEEISLNNNTSEWEKEDELELKISSLNCRSLKKHHDDIKTDMNLVNSDIICLQETWLEDSEIIDDLEIPGFDLHLNSKGKGKGIAIYFKSQHFQHQWDIKEDQMQLSKFNSKKLAVVVLYKSQQESQAKLNQAIEMMTKNDKTVLVIGDFNFCYLENSSNLTNKYMKERQFKQLIKEPTHIEGNMLDHAHLRDVTGKLEAITDVQGKYYTDHKSLNIIIR